MNYRFGWLQVVLLGAVITVVGCGRDANDAATKGGKSDKVASATKHDNWWCDEHGIPEHECSMCSAKVAADCKKKGDWCDQHERAKSQCFICDPKLQEVFAVKYRAKYGKEPPPIEEEKTDAKVDEKKVDEKKVDEKK